MGAGSLFAQTTIATLGFEAGDEKGKSSEYALTPGESKFGDFVNVKDEDSWDEECTDEPKSGQFCLFAENGATAGNSWDRGFKIAKLPIKENTPYRVSFWIKADGTYTDDEGVKNTALTSWLSQGIENFDKSICSKSGYNYGIQMTSGLTGEWQRISFVSFYTNADVLNNIIADQSWVGNAVFPKDFGGDGTQTYAEYFDHKLPNEFFLVVNMYSPTEYYLDDIKIEEGVTFNAATFSNSANAIKLDFGYQTNIKDLANQSNGSFSLDPACVKVTINGEPATVEYLEGKSDGFLYLFMADNVTMEETDEVLVSFTPDDKCPIVYNSDCRPSADTEADMPVLGFVNEVAYFDDDIDAMPIAWSPATLVKTVPENESFEIDPATFKNIALTYDKKLDLSYASATLSRNGVDEDLTDNMSLSEDGMTINIAVAGLSEGEYTLVVAGVANSYGVDCLTDQTITFALGEDHDTSTSEVVYASDFDNGLTDGVPQGWLTKDATGIHQYGFMDEEQTIQYRYGWGHQDLNPNHTQGGARLYQGFSGDFKKALYWCSRDTNEGYTSYGEIVKDYIQPDGSIDPSAPDSIALVLEPRKYQVSFVMAAWKGAPVFRFTLEDLNGNVYAQFNDFVAKPNMNGATGPVSGSLKCTTDFTVDKAGYYVLKFAAQDAPWQEFLLANVKLITMPSKAAYWKQQLAAALEKVYGILDEAEEEKYDGETKTAFAAAVLEAETGHFTAPSAIQEMIATLDQLGAKMQARVENINAFNNALENATLALAGLEGKYLDAPLAKDASELITRYGESNPSDLSDEELAQVTPKLVTAAAQMENVKDVTDILTWGAYKAAQFAENVDADPSDLYNLVEDDREVIDEANLVSTIALYNILAESEGEIADELKSPVYWDGSYIVEDGEYVATNPEEVAVEGIDVTGFIQNPHFYTFSTNSSANLEDNTIVGWNCEQLEGGSVRFSGDAATEAKPVTDVMINAYGAGGEYNFYQTIENAPVGIYDIWIGSRTASNTYKVGEESIFETYNAMNDDTGFWDKYIYAQVDNEAATMTPFAVGGWGVHPTVIRNVTVREGSKLTIGIVEHYVSGKATKNGEALDFWDTNTFADDARLFFVAPLPGYDYAKAAQDLTAIKAVNTVSKAPVSTIYSVSGTRLGQMQKGVNIVKRADGSVSKVLVK